MEVESKEDGSGLQSKTTSPFNDLYQMIKKSLDVKTPRKSSASLLQTPTSRLCTPKPGSVRKNVISTEDNSTPKKNGADEIKGEAENTSNGTPKSVKKQRKSFQVPSTEMARPEAESAAKSEATSPQKRNRTTPQRFTVGDVTDQISETPKSPMRRRSKEATPAKPAVTSPKTEHLRKASPRNSGKAEKGNKYCNTILFLVEFKSNNQITVIIQACLRYVWLLLMYNHVFYLFLSERGIQKTQKWRTCGRLAFTSNEEEAGFLWRLPVPGVI